jgi:transcriptional regulator with XRE-family HTH domain
VATGTKRGRLSLRALRQQRGLTQEAVALLGGIDTALVSRIERGLAKPRPTTVVRLALLRLRECGVVPWSWIVDETRAVDAWMSAPTVAEYARAMLEQARIDTWRAGAAAPGGEPFPGRRAPGLGRRDLVPLAATNGQVGGFLRTDVAPLLSYGRRVLYLGDHDWQGHQIEATTKRVLSQYAELRWERLALLPEHVRNYGLPVVTKPDRRYRPVREYPAVETEALSQRVIVGLVRDRLDELLPEPLEHVLVRERRQREQVAALLRQ